jgi:adenylate cyclase
MVRVLGKQQPIRLFELLDESETDIDPTLLESLPHYRAGLTAYRNADWTMACEHFHEAQLLGRDNPSWILLERCRRMMQTPPAGEWCGVWDMTGK